MKIEVKSTLQADPTIDDVIKLILHNRNVKFEEQISHVNSHQKDQASTWNVECGTWNFFTPPNPVTLSLSDFGFEKEYIDNAMRLVWSFFGSEKPIIVYSDYDADGITGGAILWETLHTLGFKAFPYIGSRVEEGYGFSKTGLDNVKKKYDPCLVISVDHGIAAKEMVTYAKRELGIPIIVTDHHHRQEDKVPDGAEAIFHIPALSGSGTAYYVAKEIAQRSSQQSVVSSQSKSQKESDDCRLTTDNLFKSDYVGLAAIGTIADLVPLIGPSRAIAKYGLEALTNTKRAGIEALKAVSGNLGKKITTYEVGFMIAPRINASGRLADALSALRLLCTRDAGKAATIASDLQALNTERQDMVKQAVSEAIAIVENMRDKNGDLPKLLVIRQIEHSQKSSDYGLTTNDSPAMQAWHEGIIGLIASKLVEKYYRPSIVCTKSDHGYKASARSIYGFHLTDFLKNFAEYLLHFGGHAAAAGLSVSGDNLPIFAAKAIALADKQITDQMLVPLLSVDCDLPLVLASIDLAKKIETLAPFGMGNERPKFVSCGKVSDVQVFGKENTHVRFKLRSDGGTKLDLIAFGKAKIAGELQDEKVKKVAYTLDINHWNNTEKLQAKLISIVEE